MSARAVSIRRTTPDDWREVRSLRLAMLADTPLAYGETLETALGHDEAEWRSRGARGQDASGISVVAIDDATGEWVGGMGGYLEGPGRPLLVGVFVAPTHRGREAGVADALLDEVERWALTQGEVLTLHVHEDNPRAVAYYRRRGFEPTGRTFAYVLAPESRELEMAEPLR